MKKWMLGLALLLCLGLGAVAEPLWYECDVKWAGAGGGGVYIVLVNPAFPADGLPASFPANSIMVSGGTDVTQANRILAAALSAMAGGKKVMVFTEAISFSEIGGLYAVTP